MPDTNQAKTPSIDQNTANSGLLFFNVDGSAVITPEAYARFCWLRVHYGQQLIPPLTNNVGLTLVTNLVANIVSPGTTNVMSPGDWIIDAERLDDFQKMTFMANNPKPK